MSAANTRSTSPNELELAILKRLPVAGESFEAERLTVVSRELTGAGSYTTFEVAESLSNAARSHVGLDKLIEVPSVPNGLGAVLWLRGGLPECLEIYTYTEGNWDGSFQGFRIVDGA